jgi:hypothetical protein
VNRAPLYCASPVGYAYLIPLLTTAARTVGYAIAVHGSMRNDLDVVAIPWTDEAASPEELLTALLAGMGWATEHPDRPRSDGPEAKPHGRVAWTIPLGAGTAIDLSVMPRRMP